MSKQVLLIVAVLLATFGFGAAAGLFVGMPSSDSSSAAKMTVLTRSGFFSDANAQNQVEANTVLSSRIRELNEEVAETEAGAADKQRGSLGLFFASTTTNSECRLSKAIS